MIGRTIVYINIIHENEVYAVIWMNWFISFTSIIIFTFSVVYLLS